MACPSDLLMYFFLFKEEIYGLVVEFGSHSTRVGFIGDDRPRVVIPSAYAMPSKRAGDLNLLAKDCGNIIPFLMP